MSAIIDGHEIHEEDLLPIGERVSPDVIEAGHMLERALQFQGQTRYVALFTRRGIEFVTALFDQGGDRDVP